MSGNLTFASVSKNLSSPTCPGAQLTSYQPGSGISDSYTFKRTAPAALNRQFNPIPSSNSHLKILSPQLMVHLLQDVFPDYTGVGPLPLHPAMLHATSVHLLIPPVMVCVFSKYALSSLVCVRACPMDADILWAMGCERS